MIVIPLIRDGGGKPLAALSVLGPSLRLTSAVLPALGQQVQQVALEISAAFGYRPPRVPQNADQRA